MSRFNAEMPVTYETPDGPVTPITKVNFDDLQNAIQVLANLAQLVGTSEHALPLSIVVGDRTYHGASALQMFLNSVVYGDTRSVSVDTGISDSVLISLGDRPGFFSKDDMTTPMLLAMR